MANVVHEAGANAVPSAGYEYKRSEASPRAAGDITLHIKDVRRGMEHEREGREAIIPSAESIQTCEDILADALSFGALAAASPMHKEFFTEFKRIYPHTDINKHDQLMTDVKAFLRDPDHKGERILLAMRLGQWQQATLQMATHITLGLALPMSSDRLKDRHNRYIVGSGTQGVRGVVQHVDVSGLARLRRRGHLLVNAPFTLLTEQARIKAKLLEEEMGQEAGSEARRVANRRPHSEWTVDHDDHLQTMLNGKLSYDLDLDPSRMDAAQQAWIRRKFGGRTPLDQVDMARARNEIIYAADMRVELIQLASKNQKNDIDPNMARMGFTGMSYTKHTNENFFKGDKQPAPGDDSLTHLIEVMRGGTDNAITRLKASVVDSIEKIAKKDAKDRLVSQVKARKDAVVGANISDAEKKRLEDEKDKEISTLTTESTSFKELLEVTKKIDAANTRISTIESGRQAQVILLLNHKNEIDTVEALIATSKQRFDTIHQTVNTWQASGNPVLMAQATTSMSTGEYHSAQTAHQANLTRLTNAQGQYHAQKATAFPGKSDTEIARLLKDYSELKDKLAADIQDRDSKIASLRPLVASRSLTAWHATNPPDIAILETNLREYEARVKKQQNEKDSIGKPDRWAEEQKKTYEVFDSLFLAEKDGKTGKELMMQRILDLDRGLIPPAVEETSPGVYEVKLVADGQYTDVKYPTYYLRILQVMYGDDILLASQRDKFAQAVSLMPLADMHRRLVQIGGIGANTLDAQSYLAIASSPSSYNKAMCDAINGPLLRRLIKSYEDDAIVGHIGVYVPTYKAEYKAITDQTPTLPLPGAFTPAVIADMEMRYYNYHDVADLGIQIMNDPHPTRGGILPTSFTPGSPTEMADLHALARAIDAKRKMRT